MANSIAIETKSKLANLCRACQVSRSHNSVRCRCSAPPGIHGRRTCLRWSRFFSARRVSDFKSRQILERGATQFNKMIQQNQ
jgi:hypothetical protein